MRKVATFFIVKNATMERHEKVVIINIATASNTKRVIWKPLETF
jgi:hypothetical protein